MFQGARTEPGGHASAPTGAAEREGRLQAQEAASQTQVAAHLGEVAESTLGQNRDPLGGGTLEAGSVAEPSEAHSACRRRRRRSYSRRPTQKMHSVNQIPCHVSWVAIDFLRAYLEASELTTFQGMTSQWRRQGSPPARSC